MVVDYSDDRERLDAIFHALGDPTRRDIVRCVLLAEHSVSALARNYPMSFAAVQKHVAALEHADLVVKRRHGREQLVRANIDTVRRATRLLDHYEQLWRERVGRMTDILDEETKGAPA